MREATLGACLLAARLLALWILGYLCFQRETPPVVPGTDQVDVHPTWGVQMPVPNLLGVTCPGPQQVVSMTRSVVVLLAMIPSLGWIILGSKSFGGTCGIQEVCGVSDVTVRCLQALILVTSAGIGWWASEFLPNLQWYIRVPTAWSQVLHCHLQWIVSEVPVGNIAWSAAEQRKRFEFDLSLTFWLIFTTFFIGKLLPVLGRFCQGAQNASMTARSASRMTASRGMSSDEDEPSLGTTLEMSWAHHLLHIFCALFSFFAVTQWFNPGGHVGIFSCWEMYLTWMCIMLAVQICQATYFACWSKGLPDLAMPMLQSVIPVVGEPAHIFKDWMFVALALGRRTLMSTFMAAISLAILRWSSLYLRRHHSKAWVGLLTPVYYACRIIDTETLASQHKTAAKLAVALTEDLPQVCVQFVFLLLCLDFSSMTLVSFIVFSCAKLAVCLLQSHAEAGCSPVILELYYRLKLTFMEFCCGAYSDKTLKHQMDLATFLQQQGQILEASELREDAALTWDEVGEYKESATLLQQVVASKVALQGPNHPDTERSVTLLTQAMGKMSCKRSIPL